VLLRGKTALITGCLRGIGNVAMQLFAREGARVWAGCQRPDPEFEASVARLAAETGVPVTPLVFDMTDADQIKAAMKQVVAAKAPVDVLVNNAGMTLDSLFPMTSMESMHKVFEVNFFSHMLLTQYVSKLMMRQKSGSIINVSSITAIDGNPGQISYSASKSAFIGATRTLASELGEHGIRVNAVAPGVIKTDMTAAIPPEALERLSAGISMRRLGLPEEVARVMLFLASDLSSYVTGQVIRIDGGIG
jgi:3-oxoacyl-[acyl-carrier protein] reductase